MIDEFFDWYDGIAPLIGPDNEYWKRKIMNIGNLIAWHDSDGSVGLEIERNEAGTNQVWLTQAQWKQLKSFGDENFSKETNDEF